MIQFQENAWTDGMTEGQKDVWKDRQTLFYRTLLATAWGFNKLLLMEDLSPVLVTSSTLTNLFKINQDVFPSCF